MGKARLVEQLAATARERGVRVLGGGCVPLGEEGLPFAPVIEALRGLADDLDADELQAVAGPGEILVSKSVRDLVVGFDIMLEDRGTPPQGRPGELAVVRGGEPLTCDPASCAPL